MVTLKSCLRVWIPHYVFSLVYVYIKFKGISYGEVVRKKGPRKEYTRTSRKEVLKLEELPREIQHYYMYQPHFASFI